MKKILSIAAALLVMICFTAQNAEAAINKKINANIKTKRVPAGTIINLKLLDSVSSSTNNPGDGVVFMITDNVNIDNETVIPKGSVIRGTVADVTAPKLLYKGGSIALDFDHVVSSTGKQVRVYARVCNSINLDENGALSSNTNYGTAISETAARTKNIVVKPVSWAWEQGEDMLNGTPKYVMAPVTALVAVPVAGIYFVGDSIVDIFKKGKNMTVEQGENITVKLLKPVDMPVY